MNFTTLIRQDLLQFSPYQSARSFDVDGEVWLNANESPFNNQLNRYPDPQPENLCQALAEIYQVEKDELLLTRGSDEGIDLLCRLFCEYQQDSVMALSPTFGMYKISASIQGVDYYEFELQPQDDFHIDIDKLLLSLPINCKILFLCSPNNPAGNTISIQDMIKILSTLKSQCMVVVDEAYIEFSQQQSAAQLINSYDHLVVLRTLSKAYGLAALRVGSLLANAKLIRWLKAIIAPYPIAQNVAQDALKVMANIKQINANIELIKSQRQYLYTQLNALSFVKKVYDSDANFLLVHFHYPVYEKLLDKGIVVRLMKNILNDRCMLRISIGLISENQYLIEQLQQLEKEYVS